MWIGIFMTVVTVIGVAAVLASLESGRPGKNRETQAATRERDLTRWPGG
jgi:hypothetical protein